MPSIRRSSHCARPKARPTCWLNGYATAQVGKCHEVPCWETSPAGPYDASPTGSGFEYFYGFVCAETNQYYPSLYEGTTPVELAKTLEEGYHLTEDLANHAIQWIRRQKSLMPNKPFLMYFAPGATRAPHHVPKEWSDKGVPTMRLSIRSFIVVFVALATLLALLSVASASTAGTQNVSAGEANVARVADATGVTPIPPGPTSSLPDYAGTPAKPHPAANSGVPQNLLLAPNGFNSCHLDPWMSDTADIPGPLGYSPVVLSSTFAEARVDPLPDPNDAPPWTFVCTTHFFDSHGRLLTVCFAPHEATVVLADPDTLEVLSHYHLEVPAGEPYKTSGRQAFMRSMGSTYSFLDARDQLAIVSGGKKIVTLVEAGSAESPVLELDNTYDLTSIIPVPGDDLTGAMLDWQGRIWLTTAGTGGPARVGVLNPGTYSGTNPNVKWLLLPSNEVIRNTFAVTKSGVDRAAAYIVTSLQMYRIDAGPDDQPYQVWSEPYDTTGEPKPGQYELGSGTSPTILGEGRYVAITDNGTPEHSLSMKVVVFRTDARLDPNEERKVCQVPVFEDQPGAALSNSLVGSRLSLIATNNYNYLWDWNEGKTLEASMPGAERIDIAPNGKGCTKVWTNSEVATTTSPRLSTKTGLIYTVAREKDPQTNVFVYYWVALDFRTGATVWKKLAGTGNQYDTFYPALAIGPNKALYTGVYGGLISMRDTR